MGANLNADPLLRNPVAGTFILTSKRELLHVVSVETERVRPSIKWTARTTQITRDIERRRLDTLPDIVQTRVRYTHWSSADAPFSTSTSDLMPQWRRRVFGARVVEPDFREKVLAENKRRAVERAKKLLKEQEQSRSDAATGSILQEAIATIGGTAKTAKLCGVTTRAVNLWVEQGGIPTTRHAITVSDAAGVAVRYLAPTSLTSPGSLKTPTSPQ
jgi:hypothetical protein